MHSPTVLSKESAVSYERGTPLALPHSLGTDRPVSGQRGALALPHTTGLTGIVRVLFTIFAIYVCYLRVLLRVFTICAIYVCYLHVLFTCAIYNSSRTIPGRMTGLARPG